jgi:hypothetical protein
MGIINFCMIAVTMLTVKQIYIPMWGVVMLSLGTIMGCTFIGWSFERYKIWDRITSHTQRKANPEIRLIVSELSEIRETLNHIQEKLG